MVVGVTSDLRVGVDIVSLHVVMRAGGVVVLDQVRTATSPTPLQLPAELPFTGLPGGTPVDVTLDAFGAASTTTPLLTRLAGTTIVAGKKLLLQVVLDTRCVVAPGSSAPTCTAPQTCIAGVCADETVAPALPAYTSTWSRPPPPTRASPRAPGRRWSSSAKGSPTTSR